MLFDGLYQSCTEKRRRHSLTSNCLSFMNNTSMVSKNDNIINVLHHLKELKNDRDLVVLSADKVNAADIMDTLKYEDKMTNFLSDESTYRLLEKDPTPSLQRKMNATLLQLKKDRKIPTTKYNTLRCSSGRIPSIYGLPKIHKPDVPLRPIVSFYSSPTYELSKFLVICLFEVQIVSHAPWMEACHHVSHQRIMRFRI